MTVVGHAVREFAFTLADFDRVRRMIRARAGIALSDHKQELVYSRLAPRLRALGLASFASYLDRVEADANRESQRFTNALTTNLTAFFREARHFEVLRTHLRSGAAGRRPRIWCAAASTGEEAYSIAITLSQHFASCSPQYEVLATDLDTAALQYAEQGLYAPERVAGLDEHQVRRYFVRTRDGARYAVRSEIRRLVTFRRLNLLGTPWPVGPGWDAIFCRNVLIYFDRHDQRRVIERLVPLLRPGGLLFVGHSEGLFQCADLVRPIDRSVYQPLTPAKGSPMP
jgi:chemotaxis protein methyltransferase CheR